MSANFLSLKSGWLDKGWSVREKIFIVVCLVLSFSDVTVDVHSDDCTIPNQFEDVLAILKLQPKF